MKVRNDAALFEYCYLVSQESDVISKPYEVEVVTPAAFRYLKEIALGAGDDNRLFRLCRKQGAEALQVQNYAGVIFTPDGTQIEVLPKLVRGSLNSNVDSGKSIEDYRNEARKALLVMLRALKGFSHIQTSSANVQQQKMPLLEVFISQFLDSLSNLVKKGIRSDYVRQEDNLSFLKGKLDIAKHLRKNVVTKHKFYCEYDEFLQDRPANRLLHSALYKLRSFTRNSANQKRLQELLFVFDEIPQSADYKSDFARLRIDRGMSYYETPLAWARLILEGFSPQTMQGNNHAISLLFPMEKVFEDYVAMVLRQQLHRDYQLKTQASSKYLVTHNQNQWFKLKPDLVIKKDKQVISVLDTKWKLIDPSKANGSDKYGLSQSDFYQMFAYGNNYFDDEAQCDREMFLIYPAHGGFEKPIEQSFDFRLSNGRSLKLWVVPFVIETQTGAISRVVWPINFVGKRWFLSRCEVN